ncbi:HdeA/HdeB family chaperone [Kiloniella sp. b19]|uniref:HdeA/HdeB family chaperone n=1 Tax=Kiloniella sp. GXU_MW_B19 TaxID=3141326 RepID=UPI0031CEF81D
MRSFKEKLLVTALAAGMGSSVVSTALAAEEIDVFDSYTCTRLVALDYAYVPTALYYIQGYLDSAGDEEVDFEEDFSAIPVERVYSYCVQNPGEVVVDVIGKHTDG